ncbi:MAG: ribosome silencing factor [Ilumatobacter sp.]|uniref:ribosome silencing factor n=1 Tax=Bacteria TaxID=2 RepID=UPI003299B716
MSDADATESAAPVTTPDDGRTLALLAARTADDKKGDDVLVLDVGDVLAIAGWFVIVSASNSRLVESLAEDIERAAKSELGISPVRTEGHRERQWVLIDYGDVVVHVFHKEMRDFYEIERLYGDVPRLDWAKTGG